MKLILLKNILFKELGYIVLIILVIGGFAYLAYSKENDFEKSLTRLNQEIVTTKNNVIKARKEYDEVVKAFKIYKNIKSQRLPTKADLNNTASRIRAATPIVDKLKERYKFSALDVTLSAIAAPKAQKKAGNNAAPAASMAADMEEGGPSSGLSSNTQEGGEKISVVENDVTIRFSGLSDELVFSLVYSLVEEFPGYLQLQNLKMSRVKNVDQELFNQASKNNELPILVTGDMTFKWRTLNNKTDLNLVNKASNKASN